MANEFIIKNGFISKGNSSVEGVFSASTLILNNITSGTSSASLFINSSGQIITGTTGTGGGGVFSGGTVSGTTTFTNGLSANTISATTIGNSGDCVDDLYVSTIHSCSPLNINPLDEGNVYFGSTSGVTIDVTNSRLGVGTTNPQTPLEVKGTNGVFSYDPTSSGGRIQVSGSTGLPRIVMTIPSYLTNLTTGISVGIRSWDDLVFSGYGKVGDSFLYVGQSSNGLNVINDQGISSEDYVRFYAGQDASSGNTPDLHIQGNGATRGFVGIGTDSPSERLDVSGKAKLNSGHYSFQGTFTNNIYTNQWQKVCSFGTPLSAFDYGAFVIKVDVGGNTTNLNTSADVNISYKEQSGSWFVYTNIINYGRTPLTTDNFDILLNISAETITVYHKFTQDYDTPTYTYVGFTPPGLVNYGTVVGPSLSGEISDSWTEKYITNGLTSAVNTGNLGVGTTSPSQKLHVSGNALINGGLTANTISATSLNVNGVNITGDTFVTGLTFNNGNYDLTIGRNDGVLFTESLSILSSDFTVTGGTYDIFTGTATFTNNTGGTFNVSGFLVGYTDLYVTGATYNNNNNTFTFTNSSGGTFNVSFDTVTGLTSTGLIKSSVLSATTYQNLPINLSDLGFVVTPVAQVINYNITLPENSNVTYPSPLIMGVGYALTVPVTTTLTII